MPVLLLVLGAVVRLRQWWGGRSLWLDEALVAESIITRGYLELVQEPLLHNQAAPALWLWAERLCVELFGPGERALRVVPLLAGIATLVLTWRLAVRLLPAVLVPVPVAVVALTPSLVYYATEVKQYAVDVPIVLATVLLALRVLGAREGHAWRPVIALAAFGCVAVWASHASVFALSGVSVLLVLRPLVARQWRRAVLTAMTLCGWLASLGVAYALLLRDLRDSPVLRDYWAYTFPDGPLGAWFVDRWRDLASTPLDLAYPALGLTLLAIGAVRLVVLRGWAGGLALATVAMAVVAAALSAYPFAGRLSLWLVPLAALALGACLPDRLDLRRAPWLLVAVALLTAVLRPGLTDSAASLREVRLVQELRPVLEAVSRERQPGDQVLIHIAARGAYDYYQHLVPVRRDGVILFITTPETGCPEDVSLRTARFATERVWVVFSHELVDTARLGSNADLVARIQSVTSISREITAFGARALLFDPIAGAQAVTPTTPRNPLRCLAVYRVSREA